MEVKFMRGINYCTPSQVSDKVIDESKERRGR